jgi:hypothetical protein
MECDQAVASCVFSIIILFFTKYVFIADHIITW